MGSPGLTAVPGFWALRRSLHPAQHADLLRRELLLCQDVGKISVYGDQPEVVYVEISRARLAALGISPQTIYAPPAGQNLVAPAGHERGRTT